MDPFTLLDSKARLAVSVGTTSPVPCVSDGACRSQQAVSHAWVPVLLSVLGHPARTQFPDAGSSVILEVSVKMLLEEMDIYVRTFERPGVPSTAQGGLLPRAEGLRGRDTSWAWGQTVALPRASSPSACLQIVDLLASLHNKSALSGGQSQSLPTHTCTHTLMGSGCIAGG